MNNAASWATYITALALGAGLLVAAPGLLRLRRLSPIVAAAALFALPLSLSVWWCAFLGGFGQASPFNTQELFILALVYVVAIYLFVFLHPALRKPGTIAVGVVAFCLAAVFLVRWLMPAIGE